MIEQVQPYCTQPGSSRRTGVEPFVENVAVFAKSFRTADRRFAERIAYPHLVPIRPLGEDRRRIVGEAIYVVGKNLALQGIDFYHTFPIPQRYVLVSLQAAAEQWHHFVLRITWCRFLKEGWYDGGGQFVKRVDLTDEELLTWEFD
ncbi:MAG: hypothetical protein R3C28_20435 [Pirellulaceae bacterium]